MTSEPSAPETPFYNVDHFLALPRLSSLTISPDGTRLVTSVATVDQQGTGYTTALWELDPTGTNPARRITRSARGESGAVFTSDSDLLFLSARDQGDAPSGGSPGSGTDPVTALWRLPRDGGEAQMLVSRPGGVSAVLPAKDSETIIVTASVLAGSLSEDDDNERRQRRRNKKVAAVLHSGYPVRYWDHDLGPSEPRLFVLEAGNVPEDDADARWPATTDVVPPLQLRNLTPNAGVSLRETAAVMTGDGDTIITGASIPLPRGDSRTILQAVDVVSGSSRVLLDTPSVDYSPGPISPDGKTLVVAVGTHTDPQTAPTHSLSLLALTGGAPVPLAPGWDRWPSPAGWLPDGSAVVLTADDDGASPIFVIDVATGEVRRLTEDQSAYTDVVISPDGHSLYALRSSYGFPPEPVRVETASGKVTALPAPAGRPLLPGTLERVEATAEDGARVASWLVLPPGASREDPAPLLLWIHGGPLGSWNAWSWRWSPWLMAAQGYAVLLPDPALSTGYGQEFIQRGWGRWGKEPYTDLLTATDSVCSRPDIDEGRTAAMGGSFGGYMANWVAGHTDRFNAVVTHASLWALDQFAPTTDVAAYWEKEMTAQMRTENSPHHSVTNIVTPMLVIHGDKDYRVPISEGLRLWYDLLSKSGLPADENGNTPHRFLYFPDENHWILKPQHARIWYLTVQHFLACHLLGEDTELPRELGL